MASTSPGPNPPAPPPPAANASIKWHNPNRRHRRAHPRARPRLLPHEAPPPVDLTITLPDYFSVLVRSKIGCRYIMVDAQCGEVLYIPGVMTPTEVRASFKT